MDYPLPEPRNKWNFEKMEILESVAINDLNSWKKAVSAAHSVGRRKGMKFQAKKINNHGRIWRIK